MSDYKKEINRYLINRKIKCSCKGFIYLVTAIEIGVNNPESLYYLAELYDIIAQKFHTKAQNVERAMRHVIGLSGLTMPNKEFVFSAVYDIKYGDSHDLIIPCEVKKEATQLTERHFSGEY